MWGEKESMTETSEARKPYYCHTCGRKLRSYLELADHLDMGHTAKVYLND
jgi:hypothetical protein